MSQQPSISSTLNAHVFCTKVISAAFFLINTQFFRFFAIKFVHFIVNVYFLYHKHSTFTLKLIKGRKSQFGRIDSRSQIKLYPPQESDVIKSFFTLNRIRFCHLDSSSNFCLWKLIFCAFSFVVSPVGWIKNVWKMFVLFLLAPLTPLSRLHRVSQPFRVRGTLIWVNKMEFGKWKAA